MKPLIWPLLAEPDQGYHLKLGASGQARKAWTDRGAAGRGARPPNVGHRFWASKVPSMALVTELPIHARS
jgi:hypothetical protein